MTLQHYDIIIVGVGISGISAAYHVQRYQAGKTFRIFERRAKLGGTWDLFNYPGIRSCLLYTSPSPRDRTRSRMPSSA